MTCSMKNKLLLCAIVISAMIAGSCGNNTNSGNIDSARDIQAINDDCKQQADFILEQLPDDSMGIPHAIVNVFACKNMNMIDTIIGTPQFYDVAEYKDMEVPADAIAACGAWYAGGGDYYYIIKKNNVIEVYHGWLDEGADDAGYHWEKVNEIK